MLRKAENLDAAHCMLTFHGTESRAVALNPRNCVGNHL